MLCRNCGREMTRYDKAIRRQRVGEAFTRGATIPELMEQFKFSERHVRRVLREAGLYRPTRKLPSSTAREGRA